MIEPMTAAEYRRMPGMVVNAVLAALEERERLLGERAELKAAWREDEAKGALAIANLMDQRDALKSDAALGALVRRIREHPIPREAFLPRLQISIPGGGVYWSLLHDGHLAECLSHLDSLLPKEPEVVTGPSGRQYRKRDDGVIETRYRTRYTLSEWCNWFPLCETILVPDAPVVAKLMEAKGD